ncbi:MAG: hypothetical protein KDE19_07045, partial [Caldilineaceae bacterium]|nr:hypothetical protein [Caldilineaceae bacterium]
KLTFCTRVKMLICAAAEYIWEITLDSHEADISSFVIRIWIEEPGDESSGTTWRGHITHVLSGKRHYFQELDAIATILSPYLQRKGVRVVQQSAPATK